MTMPQSLFTTPNGRCICRRLKRKIYRFLSFNIILPETLLPEEQQYLPGRHLRGLWRADEQCSYGYCYLCRHGFFWEPFGWVTLRRCLCHIIACSGPLHHTFGLLQGGDRATERASVSFLNNEKKKVKENVFVTADRTRAYRFNGTRAVGSNTSIYYLSDSADMCECERMICMFLL